MPNRPHAGAAATWKIHSVPLRTRNGPERLDQVYRRLLDSPPRRCGMQRHEPTIGHHLTRVKVVAANPVLVLGSESSRCPCLRMPRPTPR